MRIRACLVADSNPGNVEQLGELVQPAVEAVAEPHQVLYVVYDGEVYLDEVEESRHGVWQVCAGEQLEQVTEIVAAVEGHPAHVGVEDDAGGHEQLSEATGVGSVRSVAGEVDPAAAEQIDGVGGGDVGPGVESAEVELPDAGSAGRAEGWEPAMLVREGEPKLDELEHVDVGLERGVVELGGGLVGPERAANDAGELRVHSNVGVVVDDLADHGELGLEVVRPHLADLHLVRLLCCGRLHRLGCIKDWSFFLSFPAAGGLPATEARVGVAEWGRGRGGRRQATGPTDLRRGVGLPAWRAGAVVGRGEIRRGRGEPDLGEGRGRRREETR
jgi:hypothetical protein